MPFADASTSEKPGAIVPHKRSNPCGTPGFVRGLSGNWQFYRNGGTIIKEIEGKYGHHKDYLRSKFVSWSESNVASRQDRFHHFGYLEYFSIFDESTEYLFCGKSGSRKIYYHIQSHANY